MRIMDGLKPFTKKHKDKFFVVLLFIFGLILLPQYGAHLDQEAEIEILCMNVRTCLEFFGFTDNGLYDLIISRGVIPIQTSVEMDHGMAVYYLITPIVFLNEMSPYIGNIVLHCYTYVWVFMGFVAMYRMIREWFGSRNAMLTMSIVFLSPRIFAQMHFNTIDIVLMSAVMMMFYEGWMLVKKPGWKDIVLFSLWGALATNMRIIGVCLWGLICIFLFGLYVYRRQMNKDLWCKILGCGILWLIFFVLITPATWSGVVTYFKYVFGSAVNYNWIDWVLFDGVMYSKLQNSLPGFYLFAMIALTIPVGSLVLMGMGAIKVGYRIIVRDRSMPEVAFYSMTLVLCGLIPALYVLVAEPPIYNGWRQFYFIYASIVILIAWGICALERMACKYNVLRVMKSALVAYIAILMIGILWNHPHQYAFYNVFAGDNIESRYELDYWDMSFKEALEFVVDDAKEGQISVGTVNNQCLWGIDAQMNAIRGKKRMRLNVSEDWRDAEYVILNTTYANMYSKSECEEIQASYRLVKEVESYGNVVCQVFKK